MALKPIIATPMASTHMRMRVQSPRLTMSATAPMVQKWVRCAMAPKATASAKAAHSTLAVEAWQVGFLHACRKFWLSAARGRRCYFSEARRSLPATAASDLG